MIHRVGQPNLWTVVALVDEASAAVVNVVRRRPVKWWREPAGDAGVTRAERVGDLVAAVARADQRIEAATAGREAGAAAPDRVPPPPRREPVLADQLAVVTYDLRRALRAAAAAGVPGLEPEAAGALAHLLVAAHDVGGYAVDDDAARAVIAWRYPDALTSTGVPPGELLLVLERRDVT